MQNPQEVQSAIAAIKVLVPEARPKIAIVLGTGLGDLAGALENSQAVNYADIPHFPLSTVESHVGRLLFGTLD
ncbi:MAG: purine-nucleoside phosphorylase, partial [Desulfovibrionaceae bacterium]